MPKIGRAASRSNWEIVLAPPVGHMAGIHGGHWEQSEAT